MRSQKPEQHCAFERAALAQGGIVGAARLVGEEIGEARAVEARAQRALEPGLGVGRLGGVAQHGAVGVRRLLVASERIEQQPRAAQLQGHRLRAVRLVLLRTRAQARLELLVTSCPLEQCLDAVGYVLGSGILALQTLQCVDRASQVAELLLHGGDLGDAVAALRCVLQLGDAPERAHELRRRAAPALQAGQRLQGLEVTRVEGERALVGAPRGDLRGKE